MIEVSKQAEMEIDEETRKQEEYNQIAFPKKKESLLEFLYRCQKKKFEVMFALGAVESSIERVRKVSKDAKSLGKERIGEVQGASISLVRGDYLKAET